MIKLRLYAFQYNDYIRLEMNRQICVLDNNKCFSNSAKNRIKERLKLKDLKVLRTWKDINGQGHYIPEMANQHIENSLRRFFRNGAWVTRKLQILAIYCERQYRIRNGRWNLSGAKLGEMTNDVVIQQNKFRKEFNV